MAVMMAFASVKSFLLDLLFPVECLGCGLAGTYLCVGCFTGIPIEEAFTCPLCTKPSFEGAACGDCRKKRGLDGLIAAASYDTALVRRLVVGCKYRFIKDFAEPMALLAVKRLAAHAFSVLYRKDTVLIPVPLSQKRLRQRGFNQAGEIALRVGAACGLKARTDILRRTYDTHPQVEMESREDRLKNIRGVFDVLDSSGLKGRAVVLVDDVATSLATLTECARVLKKSGAGEVWGLVVAREHTNR